MSRRKEVAEVRQRQAVEVGERLTLRVGMRGPAVPMDESGDLVETHRVVAGEPSHQQRERDIRLT
jgi:hypothetical protein